MNLSFFVLVIVGHDVAKLTKPGLPSEEAAKLIAKMTKESGMDIISISACVADCIKGELN